MTEPTPQHGQITALQIRGFKSIERLDLPMGRINLLIGANGAGKSNFIGFFRMVRDMLDGNLQKYVGLAGGPIE